MLREVAVENYTHIPQALAAGADRIELNDNLAVGGTTVSKGVMAESAKYVHEHGRSLVTMIRPRGGNFVYNDTELKIMEADLFEAQALGVDGVAFGALTADGLIDEDAMTSLIAASAGMSVVFHMAFDAIPEDQQPAAIDWLAAHHVDRILTHGGPLTTPIESTLPHLQTLIAHAADQITILPGGGITSQNATAIADKLGVKELHGTKLIQF
ncbi:MULTISPECIES: copper homeostasis protein CutC [Lacticaseibacillus]|uniref:PF03932 family protein CutC n=1 Tax=Lacticaseibacillus casei DSM 20011 = JCM 1134 = ATCC 393 TaxID=1423732 RepID=A0AAD1AN63_LACCA|nr:MULTISPECIES: copper homeostasis protein CutC [Lacticaseibacillus]HAJ55535.1 copper homeostasis protein CutC [Lactobacillus sp.]KLI74920.1 copper homeostasis protein CutC [Lacticaseibacillus casei]MBI6596777.1 copper homeostasis protein CutC [Lacticaseibacillus casei]MBO1480536.1 copper homeostasis protein CutC [Lacticaseibacillus casei]MBO2415834.1 copper homeostasis protein CutC [Lacticaseibacillus casei]